MFIQKKERRNPWIFIPTLYFAEGLPYVIVNTLSVILYKRMGVSNAEIGKWTSLLYLPWVIKMFWGPLVDVYSTKRKWVTSTQLALSLFLAFLGISINMPFFLFASMMAFFGVAFVSATHDVAADGAYMLALNQEEQAFFVGIRAAFYRLAMVFGSGFLVFLAGRLEVSLGDVKLSWTLVMNMTAVIFIFLYIYHRVMLPYPAADFHVEALPEKGGGEKTFMEIFQGYFSQKNIGIIIAFILCYRLGEAVLLKMAPPFLLDPPGAGGMGLSTSQVGLVYGTVGIASLVAGGIAGGWIISRYGFRRCIWPFALVMNLPNLLYVILSYAHPGIETVYAFVALEQFGYGAGFAAFPVYLMFIADPGCKTSHFAISTGIMALGMMLPGMLSGYMVKWLGYNMFFVVCCLLTVPGMLVIPFLPTEGMAEKAAPAKA